MITLVGWKECIFYYTLLYDLLSKTVAYLENDPSLILIRQYFQTSPFHKIFISGSIVHLIFAVIASISM